MFWMSPNKRKFQFSSMGGGGGGSGSMNRSRIGGSYGSRGSVGGSRGGGGPRGGSSIGYRGGSSKGRGGYGRDDGYGHSYEGEGSGGYGGRHLGGMGSGNQMLNPWESGVVPMSSRSVSHGGYMPYSGGSGGGGGSGSGGSLLGEFRGGSSDIVGSINHLSQMNNPESKLALNILNAVLSKDEGHQSGWSSGPPVNKRKRMDMDGGYDSHGGQSYAPPMHHQVQVHKFPQRDQQYGPHRAGNFASPRRGRGGRFTGQAGRQMTTQQPFRKTVTVKKGKPINNRGNAKNQKKKGVAASGAATGTAGGQKGDKTESDGSSASAEPKQSGEVKKEDTEEKETEREEVKGDDKKTEEKVPKKPATREYSTPKEALRCHFCHFYKFNSIMGFKNHLESKNHEQMERTFHMKGAAVLQFLRAQSKLAAQRNILRLRRKGSKGRIMKCTKCQCSFMGSPAEHSRTREHFMVSNYSKCSACRLWFGNRIELEKHRLSFHHLAKQAAIDQNRLEKALKAKKTEEVKIPEQETLKKFHDAVDRLRLNQRHTNVFSTNQIPVYDASTPIGLNFMFKKSLYYCTICPIKSIPSASEALVHFSSEQHYENYAAHLKTIEENKKLEAKQEDDNKENEQKEDDSQEKDQETTDQEPKETEEQPTVENVEDVEPEGEEEENVVEMVEEEVKEDKDTSADAKMEEVIEEKCDVEVVDQVVDEPQEQVQEQEQEQEENNTPDPTEGPEKATQKATDDSVDEAPAKKDVVEEVKTEEVVSTPRSRRGRARGRGRGAKK